MFFKIIRGYSAEDFIEITQDELQKAYYCFLEKKDAVFSGGAVRGAQILAIQPDYHKTMGWNRGYKLGDDDFAEMKQKGIDRKLNLVLRETKKKIEYLIQTNQTHLVGKEFEMPKIESPLSDEVKSLAESKRIK